LILPKLLSRARKRAGLVTKFGSNYSFLRTFWRFWRGSRHFGLYSPDYTATRIMEIFPGQGIKDIGGEERRGDGLAQLNSLYLILERMYSGNTVLLANWSPIGKIR
jgi:hypothetical protein